MNQDQACPKRVWGVRYTYQPKPILWVDVCRKDLVSPLRIDRPRNCFGKINGKGFPIFQRKRATLSFLFLYGRWLQQWCSKHSRCFLPLSHCQGEVLLMTNFDPIRRTNWISRSWIWTIWNVHKQYQYHILFQFVISSVCPDDDFTDAEWGIHCVVMWCAAFQTWPVLVWWRSDSLIYWHK